MIKKKTLPQAKIEKPTVSRPDVHSKKRTSAHKNSRNYKKPYKGQGR